MPKLQQVQWGLQIRQELQIYACLQQLQGSSSSQPMQAKQQKRQRTSHGCLANIGLDKRCAKIVISMIKARYNVNDNQCEACNVLTFKPSTPPPLSSLPVHSFFLTSLRQAFRMSSRMKWLEVCMSSNVWQSKFLWPAMPFQKGNVLHYGWFWKCCLAQHLNDASRNAVYTSKMT